MAELTESPDDAPTSTCCAPEQQTDCCDPSGKADCCSSDSSSCGCSAGQTGGAEIREAVRSRYAAAAESVTDRRDSSGACRGPGALLSEADAAVFGAALYGEGGRGELLEITETHRVHDSGGSAIIRARKPS